MKNLKKIHEKLMATSLVALSLLAFVSFSLKVQADDISLGVPGYGGTGCPAGSASVTLSPDKKTLSLIFDSFQASTEGYKRLDRKSCNIAIPVHVPQGFSVSILQVDYRGFNSLPYGATSQFNAEYFFAGSAGPKIAKTFRGPVVNDYLVRNDLVLTGLVYSRCGEDVNLRVNSSILVRTNSALDEAFSTVDSADFQAGIIYKLQWKRC